MLHNINAFFIPKKYKSVFPCFLCYSMILINIFTSTMHLKGASMNFHLLSDKSIQHIVNGSTLSGYPFLDNDSYHKEIIVDIKEACDSFSLIHYILDFSKFIQSKEVQDAGLIGFKVDYISWGSKGGSSLKKTLIPLYKSDICTEEKEKIEEHFALNRKKFPGSQTSREKLSYLFHSFNRDMNDEPHIYRTDQIQDFLYSVFGRQLYSAIEKKLILNNFIQKEKESDEIKIPKKRM